jgi:Ulp1 family protease
LKDFIGKWLLKLQLDVWTYGYGECPQQPKTYLCGVHCCMHLLSVATDINPIEYEGNDVESIRTYMVESIMSQKLILENHV